MEQLTEWIIDELKEQKLYYNFGTNESGNQEFEILSGTYSCFIEIGDNNLLTYCKSSVDHKIYFERVISKDVSKTRLSNIIHHLIYETREKNTGNIRIGQKISEIRELMDKYNIPLITVENMITENFGKHDV